MLPERKESAGSPRGRRWGVDLLFIVGAAAVAWIAIDQISDEQRVLAKFAPPPPPRMAPDDSKQQLAEVASVSRTATAAVDNLNATPTTQPTTQPATQPATQPTKQAIVVAAAPSQPTPPAAAPKDLVGKAFEEWVRLWQARDATSYIGLYASNRADLKGHLRIRSQRIQKAKFIEVSVSDVSIRQSGPSEMTVRFVQSYRSDTHSSRDTKELVWSVASQQPKIIAERLVN